jgi:hypothetical protein
MFLPADMFGTGNGAGIYYKRSGLIQAYPVELFE